MLKYMRYVITLSLLTAIPLSAFIHPSPGKREVEADYLYLMPSGADCFFVADSVTTQYPNGDLYNNSYDFSSGFRVGGSYGFCKCNQELRAYYTRLAADTTTSIYNDNPYLFATTSMGPIANSFQHYAGSATASSDTLYQRVDGLWGIRAWDCCCLNFYLYAGLEWAYNRCHDLFEYYNQEATGDAALWGYVDFKGKGWGIGPQFGCMIDYALWENRCGCLPGTLSLSFMTTGSLLAHKKWVNIYSDAVDADGSVYNGNLASLNNKANSSWKIIPALHARVGVNYGACISCLNFLLEVGYQFDDYINAIMMSAITPAAGQSAMSCAYADYCLQGLYVSLGATF